MAKYRVRIALRQGEAVRLLSYPRDGYEVQIVNTIAKEDTATVGRLKEPVQQITSGMSID